MLRLGYLWRQWENGHNRFKELRRRGVPQFNAAVAAGSPTGYWRMSGHPAVQMALRNHSFHSLGLPRLYVSADAQPGRTAVDGPVRTVVWGDGKGNLPSHPIASRQNRRRAVTVSSAFQPTS